MKDHCGKINDFRCRAKEKIWKYFGDDYKGKNIRSRDEKGNGKKQKANFLLFYCQPHMD